MGCWYPKRILRLPPAPIVRLAAPMKTSTRTKFTAMVIGIALSGTALVTGAPAQAAVQLKPAWGTAIGVGGPNFPYANAFAVSPTSDGGAYVAGTFNKSADFGSTKLQADASTGFLAKISPRGRWLWAIKTAESAAITAGVTTTPDGGAIMCILSRGDNFLDPNLSDDAAVTVAKVASDSSVQWVEQLRASYLGSCSGAESLADGGAIVAGSRWNPIGDQGYPVNGSGSAAIGRISPMGTWLWTTSMGGRDGQMTSIDITPQGTIVAGGTFKILGDFGQTTLTDTSTPSSNAGPATGNGFVAFASLDGVVTDAQQLVSPERSQVLAVTALSDGGVVVAGNYREELTAGTESVRAKTFEPGFAASLGADGSWNWIYQWSGSNFGTGTGVTQTNDGAIIVAGLYNTSDGAYLRLNSRGKRTKVYRVRDGAIGPNAVAADNRGGFLTAGTLYGTWKIKGKKRVRNNGTSGTGYVARLR